MGAPNKVVGGIVAVVGGVGIEGSGGSPAGRGGKPARMLGKLPPKDLSGPEPSVCGVSLLVIVVGSVEVAVDIGTAPVEKTPDPCAGFMPVGALVAAPACKFVLVVAVAAVGV